MTDDPNLELGPFVEGMVFGAMDWPRLFANTKRLGWSVEMEELDRHAIVVTSPSGIRWRVIAQLLSEGAQDEHSS